jgi:hypothetical protein
MENMGIIKFTAELQKLNPDTVLVYDMDFFPAIIYCNCEPRKLKLPKGYYYTEKNGITNKHNTQSGAYEMFDCYKCTEVACRDND